LYAQTIFRFDTLAHHIDLQAANGPDDHVRPESGLEELRHAFLGQAFKRFA
jgi:hypothetical protein